MPDKDSWSFRSVSSGRKSIRAIGAESGPEAYVTAIDVIWLQAWRVPAGHGDPFLADAQLSGGDRLAGFPRLDQRRDQPRGQVPVGGGGENTARVFIEETNAWPGGYLCSRPGQDAAIHLGPRVAVAVCFQDDRDRLDLRPAQDASFRLAAGHLRHPAGVQEIPAFFHLAPTTERDQQDRQHGDAADGHADELPGQPVFRL